MARKSDGSVKTSRKKVVADPGTDGKQLNSLKASRNDKSSRSKGLRGSVLRRSSSNSNLVSKDALRCLVNRSSTKPCDESEEPTEDRLKPERRVAFAEEDEEIEDDPVIALFETRNTNRVRFNVEEDDENSTSNKDSESPDRNAALKESNSLNIKAFMKKNLFGGNKKGGAMSTVDTEDRQQPDMLPRSPTPPKAKPTMVWESAETGDSPEIIQTTTAPKTSGSSKLMVSFTEDKKTRSDVARLLAKAKSAQHKHYNYAYAIKCYVKALNILKAAKYPEDHPSVYMTLEALNNAHHAESSFKNSANIVKMGLRHEEKSELVKALKMYTIAYRIRRDNLSKSHPSLIVLLNMLGSIQIKRGELKEAMQIYELALNDAPISVGSDDEDQIAAPSNPLAKSVSYRDMGTIYEKWHQEAKALEMFHKSLECASEWREAREAKNKKSSGSEADSKKTTEGSTNDNSPRSSFRWSKSSKSSEKGVGSKELTDSRAGAMEVFLSTTNSDGEVTGDTSMVQLYNSFFVKRRSSWGRSKRSSKSGSGVRYAAAEERDCFADVDVALTLHQIGQLYRKQSEYHMALDAYNAALRGMKQALGPQHPNVAAILGNIGNLHKEKGDMDSAYETYQEVVKLESSRLGLSHPEVAITLHNIGTIEAARGNYEEALHIYSNVVALQRRVLGEDNTSVAATTACMGDVYEKLGNIDTAMKMGEEALKIKMKTIGKHTIEVARMLHKLSKLAFKQKLLNLAQSYITRALLIYRLNKVDEAHDWIVDALRDSADIDAALVMGAGRFAEC